MKSCKNNVREGKGVAKVHINSVSMFGAQAGVGKLMAVVWLRSG